MWGSVSDLRLLTVHDWVRKGEEDREQLRATHGTTEVKATGLGCDREGCQEGGCTMIAKDCKHGHKARIVEETACVGYETV